MQRQIGLLVVMDVGEGFHRRKIDTEAGHENASAKVERFIRRQLEEAELGTRACEPETCNSGTATGPVEPGTGKQVLRLSRLTQHKNKA